MLVLISSAAIAVTIAARKAGQRGWTIAFGVIAAVFLYTTVVNVIERPDGVKIGACFIAGIILVSLLSRLARAFELRVTSVALDPMAERFVRDMASRRMRFIANEPGHRDKAEYRDKIEQIRADNEMPEQEDFVFVEVTVTDPSEFEAGLTVRGEVLHGRYRVLTLESASIRTPSPRSSSTSGTPPGAPRTSTSSGPRATRSQTSCASSSSARARSPPSRARCCARRNRTGTAGHAYTRLTHRPQVRGRRILALS